MNDIVYYDFFIKNEKFTVENYAENSYALFCEDSFVCELNTLDRKEAYAKALEYETKR